MESDRYTSYTSGVLTHEGGGVREDPHFEEIVNELRDIQIKVDVLVFGSVFLRRPNGLPLEAFVPNKPADVPSLEETISSISGLITQIDDLEDRLKDLLDNRDHECFEDQIEEYQRDLQGSSRTLRVLKPLLSPERLREGEVGKSDVSWLSWRRNTLGDKMHRETNELLTVLDAGDCPKKLGSRLRASDALIHTANTMLQSTQYLAWFTRRVVEYNDSLDEFERDFTVNLVSQWVQEEANKVQEHHRNCVNLRSEIIQKLDNALRSGGGSSTDAVD